jgi:atypical dual specificity phosphatase
LAAFNSHEVAERIIAGRNPLTRQDVQLLAAQGVTHILDLREAHEWAPPKFGGEALEEIVHCGLHRLSLPVVDTGPPTAHELETACRFIEAALVEEGSCIFVHCRAGMERTAAILTAFYARHHGTGYDEALATLKAKRPILEPLPNQERAVRGWLQH